MIQIVTKIIVKGKSPQQIFDWMRNLNQEKYLQWHPIAHKTYRQSKETEDLIGSVIYFNEEIDSFRVDYEWEFVEVKKSLPISVEIKMKAKYFYPIYLNLSAKKVDIDTDVTHKLQIGFYAMGLEKIFDWFVRKFIFTKRQIEALERHATEEFKNLENII